MQHIELVLLVKLLVTKINLKMGTVGGSPLFISLILDHETFDICLHKV